MNDLYRVAKEVCHEFGMDWTDPRTGQRYKAPKATHCKECGAAPLHAKGLCKKHYERQRRKG